MTTIPLDTGDLFARARRPATEPFDGLPEGTVMGHVHLCVADVEAAVAFYRDTLGFDLMAQLRHRRRRSSRPAATTTTSA